MEATLEAHLDLCDRVYAIILEENQILKATNAAPEESFLSKKREVLAPLDDSIRNLRKVNALAKSEHSRSLIARAQGIVMKALLLDRENEQLLLKQAMPVARKPLGISPSVTHLQRLYSKHAR